MWKLPIALMGGGTKVVSIASDTYIGDLWMYLGSPSGPVEVEFTVDGADAAEIIIPLDFHASSTFQFTAINGGRFVGVAGAGGDGGDDNGASGTAGSHGTDGGAAIQSNTFNINVDVDDGYLLGGGGGGGGGSYNDTGAAGTPGGGGGGGRGWGDAAGGAAGSPTSTPVASAGTAGSTTTTGLGGSGGTSGTNDGGDGGGYGFGGVSGMSTNIMGPSSTLQYYGGVGGLAGPAFESLNSATITFNGASSEATLRAANRVMGETDDAQVLLLSKIYGHSVSVAGSSTHGFSFQTDGDLTKTSTPSGPTGSQSGWLSSVSGTPGNNYQIRPRNLAGDVDGTWTSEPTPGTWVDISTARSWTFTSASGTETVARLVEIRRDDAGAGADEVMASTIIWVTDENGL